MTTRATVAALDKTDGRWGTGGEGCVKDLPDRAGGYMGSRPAHRWFSMPRTVTAMRPARMPPLDRPQPCDGPGPHPRLSAKPLLSSALSSSTLPPSYRTRRSIPDLFHHAHPSPPLPPVPPSAYRRNRRHSRGAGRLVADLQAAGWGRDTPDGEGEGAHNAAQQEHGSGMQRKRSKDGGVRLQGGRPGEQPLEPDDDSAEVNDVGSTRPPSYG